MYLKKLESVGFKSFAERINVDFVPGVTAVVGPNGSGKSNITDAIRWVLGEQSARSLRGTKMEDIIFQGSEGRRPLNVAEVTLVLDNADKAVPLDYDEVSITRRVYRSGDSEFYINKQSCRLKDIVDLFMDSGLGREAFSIISQGKVEEILSSKSEERRAIFEEAAGVLKYKHRKKKAEYKLLETQENLNRVEDIIHEIATQLDPLKNQAETARIYLKQKEQLKTHEIALLITEIEQFNETWQLLRNELDKEKLQEIALKTAIQQKGAAITKERQVIQAIDDQIDSLQNSLLTTTQEFEQHEGKRRLLNERTKHFAESKKELESSLEESGAKIERLESESQKENEKLSLLLKSRNKTKHKLRELEAKLSSKQENIAEKLEGLKADYIECLNNRAANRNERQSIQQQLQQITAKENRQKDKFSVLLSLRDELDLEHNNMKQDLTDHQKICSRNETAIKQIKNELENGRKNYQDAQTKLYQGYQYLEKLKSKKEMLEEMKEEFQGFFYGVKEILKARQDKRLQQIHGAVIELVDVPKQYITAIETVLGGQAQHIIVQSDAAARKAITWLKETNKGRATFLPIESVQARYIPAALSAKIRHHQGFVGIAAELVSCQAPYKTVMDHLMGHVVIVKTLKDANEVAGMLMRRYKVVTLDGDVVNPGGSMSGGAKKKTNQSLFTRDKDLQETMEKLTAFQAKTITFESAVKQQKDMISRMSNDLDVQQEMAAKEQKKTQEIQTALHEIVMKRQSIGENLMIYDQDKQQSDADAKSLTNRDKILTNKLADTETELAKIQKEMDRLQDMEAQFKEDREQLQEEFQYCRVTVAEQEERLKNQREKTDGLRNQLTELTGQHDSYAKKLADLIDLKQGEVTEAELNQKMETVQRQKAEITVEIQQKRLERQNRTQHIDDQERETKEENKHYQMLMTSIQEKEVKVNRLDVELENRLNVLQLKYTLTFERAKKQYEKTKDVAEAKRKVSELKEKIAGLGSVNEGAIDEYDRISKRHHFLTEQQTDLVHAKQTLYSAIAEMDEEMEKRFEATFSQIKHEFELVFKELFGGGHAELKLTDPKNMLQTGVDVVAQPPGKKLQQLGLLSGGERALTAIALLFAILRVRPVPFCVLDEVEAALDEANVARFAKYVKMYSDKTQFIVITHRKGTMEEADVLYGITMQESGVSRLVSVRLEDTQELVKA